MKLASGVVFWGGMVLIGILAVPTAILVAAISVIWKGAGALMQKLEPSSSQTDRLKR